MKKIVLISLVVVNLWAQEYMGVGFGKTQKEAKKEALSDLSMQIKANVSSTFETNKKRDGSSVEDDASSHVVVSSNLPILGASYDLYARSSDIEASATLSSQIALKSYKRELERINEEISILTQTIKTSKNNIVKIELYNKVLNYLNEFSRYNSVAMILGIEGIAYPKITKAEVEAQLIMLSTNITSLEQGAAELAKVFTQKNIFLYPMRYKNLHEVSEFSAAFQQHFKSHLQRTDKREDAKYLLTGSYSLIGKKVLITYTLIEASTHKQIAAKTITLAKQAYQNLRIKPQHKSVDVALHQEQIISSKLHVSLSTNRGDEDLLFIEGEEIELLTKLNHVGYFYIVGSTNTSKGKFAYLLELEEGEGNDKFIYYVGASQVNRVISLGTFEASAPFGLESLQIIASDTKPEVLPSSYYDEGSGYYKISGKPHEVIAKTRGFIKKKLKAKRAGKKVKAEVSEAVLMFTTLKK